MRCLVVQTAFLGDVILTVPLLDLLRRDPRTSRIFVVAAPPGAGFLEEQGIADRVVTYDKRGRDAGVGGMTRVIRELRELSAEVALVPHRSFRSACLALASGARRRVGFDVSGGRLLFTERVPYLTGVHEVERVAALAGPLGVVLPDGRVPFELSVPDRAGDELASALSDRGVGFASGAVVVAPGSRWATKRWLPERFSAAAEELSRELDTAVVVVGSHEERDIGAVVSGSIPSGAADLTGRLSLKALLALVSRARVVLSNDSAVTHMAAGLGTPVVSVFGSTVPAQGFAPYADRSAVVETPLDCRPCGRHGSNSCPLGTLECMEGVSVGDVVSRALELVGREADGA